MTAKGRKSGACIFILNISSSKLHSQHYFILINNTDLKEISSNNKCVQICTTVGALLLVCYTLQGSNITSPDTCTSKPHATVSF